MKFVKDINNYYPATGNEIVKIIPQGIYSLEHTRAGFHLEKQFDEFTFRYKLYDLQTDFIEHIIKTYENTKGDLGLLMNGHKGSGKTVTAKLIANRTKLPVIIVKSFGENNDELVEFLSSLEFDHVLFFDEFEKQFKPNDPMILQITDGVYQTNVRRILLLTTNSIEPINPNLISRPARVRYLKQFGNLPEEIVDSYISENLIDKNFIDEIKGFIDSLEISTIDILKTVVEEVNIHGNLNFKENLNVSLAHYEYTTYRRFAREITQDNLEKHIEEFDNEISNFKNSKDSEDELRTYYVATQKPFMHLTTHDMFNLDEPVYKIYENKSIVVTKIGIDFVLYKITNPKAAPSLYNKL